MQQPKARREMDPRWMWDLSAILDGAPAFDALFAQAEQAASALPARQGHVAEDPRAAIRAYFDLTRMLERLFTYARMRTDEDGSDSEAQALLTRVQTLAARAGSAAQGSIPV